MDSIVLTCITILTVMVAIILGFLWDEYKGDINLMIGGKLTTERARRMADKKTRIKEEKEFEKVLGEILWLSKEAGRRQLKHVEFNERYVEALRQLGYEVEEEPEPHSTTGIKGYKIKW